MSVAKPLAGPWCRNCGDAFDAPERPCPNPSPGEPYAHCGRGGHMFDVQSRVEVDALALMLDGATVDGARLGRVSLEHLEARRTYLAPLMERTVARPEWAEVAEAILELEAWADYYGCARDRPSFGPLAVAADRRVDRTGRREGAYLEAAAILRDGWRPGKRSKR